MNEKKSYFNADVIFGLISIVFSVIWFILALDFKEGTADGTPGAGVFPIGVSLVCIFFSILMMAKGIKQGSPIFKVKEIPVKNLIACGLTIVIFIAFFLVWYFWHYIPATIMMMVLLSLVYKRKLISSIIFAVIFACVVYFAFSSALMVVLKIS